MAIIVGSQVGLGTPQGTSFNNVLLGVPNKTTDPPNGNAGDLYWDAINSKHRIHNGTDWENL